MDENLKLCVQSIIIANNKQTEKNRILDTDKHLKFENEILGF